MARNKTKICFGCQRLFEARRDAKTCSTKCRKRFQRAKILYYESKPVVWQRSTANFKNNLPGLAGDSYAK